MAEKLALEQLARHGCAVDANKRAVLALRGLVDGTGNEFLSRAALADDKDVGIGGGNHLDLPQDTLCTLGTPQNLMVVRVSEDFFLKVGILFLESLA